MARRLAGLHAAEIGWNVLGANLPSRRRDGEPPAGVDELAHVARPIESHERILGRRGQKFRLDTELLAGDRQVVPQEFGYVLAALAQRGDFDAYHIEPVQ